MKVHKRVLAALLTLSMVLTFMPTMAFAAAEGEPDTTEPPAVETQAEPEATVEEPQTEEEEIAPETTAGEPEEVAGEEAPQEDAELPDEVAEDVQPEAKAGTHTAVRNVVFSTDFEIEEYSVGGFDTDSHVWWYHADEFIPEGTTARVTFTDGVTEVVEWDDGEFLPVEEDSETSIDVDGFEDPGAPGTWNTTYTVYFAGPEEEMSVEQEVEVTILPSEPRVTGIEYEPEVTTYKAGDMNLYLHSGDQLTVRYANGTSGTYTYDGYEFYDDDGETVEVPWDWLYTTGDWSTAGSTDAKINLFYKGKVSSVPVTIIENNVASIELSPARDKLVAYEYYENADYSEARLAVLYDPGNELTVHYKNDTSAIYELQNIGDAGDWYVYFNQADSEDWFEADEVSCDLDYDLWNEEGEGQLIVTYAGASCNVPLEVRAGFEEIVDFEPAEAYKYYDSDSYTEETEDGEEYTRYWYDAPLEGDKLTLLDFDGNETVYTYSCDDNFGDCWIAPDGAILTNQSVFITDDQREIHWTSGVDQTCKLVVSAFYDELAFEVPVLYGGPGEGGGETSVVESAVYTGVPHEVEQYSCGFYDEDEQAWFYDKYSIFDYGDTVTVTYADGTERVFSWDGNGSFSSPDTEDYIELYASADPGQPGEHHFSAGYAAYNAELDQHELVHDFEIPFVITNDEPTVSDLSYSPVVTEYMEGDKNVRFHDGDRIYLEYSDGTTAHYTYNDSPEEFVNDDDGTNFLYVDESALFAEGPWTVGSEGNRVGLFYRGRTGYVDVTIIENPVASIAFEPARELIVYEYSQDNYDTMQADRSLYMEDGHRLTINFTDGETQTYIFDNLTDAYINTEDPSDMIPRQQIHWAYHFDHSGDEVDAALIVTFAGRTCEVPLTVKPGFAEMEYNPANMYFYYSGTGKQSYDQDEEEYFHYYYQCPQEGDEIKLTDLEGGTTYLTCSYNAKRNKYEWTTEDGQLIAVDTYDEQGYEHWEEGIPGYFIATVGGYVSDKVTVYHFEGDMTVTYQQAEPKKFYFGIDDERYDEEEGWWFSEYDIMQEGDVVTAIFPDGHTEIFDVVNGDGGVTLINRATGAPDDGFAVTSDQNEGNWEVGSHTATFLFRGKTCTLNVEVLPNPVEDFAFEIDLPARFAADEVAEEMDGWTYYDIYSEGARGPHGFFAEGDQAIVYYNDGRGVISYRYDEEEDDFFDESGEKIPFEVYCPDNGQFEEHWSIGQNVQMIRCAGHDAAVYVTIYDGSGGYAEPTYEWTETEDGYEVTGTCEYIGDDSQTVTEEATVSYEVAAEPTCEEAGTGVYTATFTNDLFSTQTREVEIEALGHDYVFTTWNWAEDYKTATAVFTCTRDAEHVLEVDANVSITEGTATCTEPGTVTYTAIAIGPDMHTYQDTQPTTTDALGHDYTGDPVWTWEEDFSAATAEWTCQRDASHEKFTAEAVITNEITTQPTCEAKGVRTYTATVTGPDGSAVTDTRTEPVDKLGHDYGEPVWNWSEDFSTATAVFTCKNDSKHVVQVPGSVVLLTDQEPNCTTAGHATATATATGPDGQIYTDSQDAVLPVDQNAHDYQFTDWQWADDGKTAKALYTCTRDASHTKLVDAEVEVVSETAATCDTAGKVIYKASVTDPDGSEREATKTITSDALGHDYTGEPEWTWADDYSTATASWTCQRDASHEKFTAEATITNEITRQPTCDDTGIKTYTATVTGPDGSKLTATAEEEVDKLGHDYGDPVWTWEDDFSKATATFTCKNDPKHVVSVETTAEDEENPITKIAETPATCEEAGSETYKATVKGPDGETYTDEKVKEIAALGHDYRGEPEWSWADDYSTATATWTCQADPTHEKLTKDAKIEKKNKLNEIEFTATVEGLDEEGNKTTYTDKQTKAYDEVAPYNEGSVLRVSGDDRYMTSMRTADALKEELGVDKFDAVVLASGDNFPDALSGSYLAYKVKAPILITNASNYQRVNEYIIANLKSDGKVYVLGGTVAIKKNMIATLEAAGYVEGKRLKRLAGADRYETNLAILEEAGVSDEEILISSGVGFADSLSASAVKRPILLVGGSLTDDQKQYLEEHGSNKVYILGGKGAVGDAIENFVKGVTGTDPKRLAGATRYETSIKIAKEFFPNATTATIAYAWLYPDGLCGGPLAAAMNCPLILTNQKGNETAANAAAVEYFREKGIKKGITFGGAAWMTNEVVKKIYDLANDAQVVIFGN